MTDNEYVSWVVKDTLRWLGLSLVAYAVPLGLYWALV